ncbi:MAG: carbohydrate ABC transporter substrate-binding protein, partial [Clostridia bacterium]|nr:carbohydrate ABC transporter substrate-binding protein [Clostridia bacterium]
DDDEYFKQMKVRMTGGLPDIMYLQTRFFPTFKSKMVDLSDLEATKNNVMAESYAVDGVVLGIPEKRSEDYVFYWADKFEAAGVAVPKTWEDFVAACEKLQAYYGETDPNFAAIAVGVKDAWPIYPFMEYAPASFSGNGTYWDLMATQDAPFAEGTEIRKAYTKIYDLLQRGVLGSDPLGIGYDQALSLFLTGSATMMADNSMGLAKIKNSGVDLTNLKTFYMPYTTEDGTFNHIVQGDFFMGVTNTSENVELAKAFVEFFFSEDWYPDYISRLASDSTMATVHKDKDPYMVYADQEQPELNVVGYIGGGDYYTAIVNESKWDYCKLGAEMLMEGFDLEAAFDKLDADWAAAREKLGMK